MNLINFEVDKMMAERVNPFPHNTVSVFNGLSFPEINHEVLKIPGKFKQREPMCGFTDDGTQIFMDQITTVDPDNININRKLAVNYEYLIGKLKPAKKERLLDYDLSIQVILGKPSFQVVITDQNYGIEDECMKIDGSAIRVLYRTFDKNILYKTLNRLNNINFHEQEMSGYDYMKWAQCIAFARQPYAQDYIEKCVDLFTRIEKINYIYQRNLHMSLKVMIKSQFKDEKTIRRLLTMITKAIPHASISGVCGQEAFYLQYRESIKVLESELTKKDDEIAKKDDEIAKKDVEIAKMSAENNAKLAKKDQENLELRKKIEKLEKEKEEDENN